jgi:hypothetical protein
MSQLPAEQEQEREGTMTEFIDDIICSLRKLDRVRSYTALIETIDKIDLANRDTVEGSEEDIRSDVKATKLCDESIEICDALIADFCAAGLNVELQEAEDGTWGVYLVAANGDSHWIVS